MSSLEKSMLSRAGLSPALCVPHEQRNAVAVNARNALILPLIANLFSQQASCNYFNSVP
jgi:hypothetical protein